MSQIELPRLDDPRFKANPKAFTPCLIEGLRDRIQGICDDVLDRAGDGHRIELIEAYALPLPLTVISDLLGVPVQDRHRFGPWTEAGGYGGYLSLAGRIPALSSPEYRTAVLAA